jgi:diguanylate cyclase (GGDEF)-like protein
VIVLSSLLQISALVSQSAKIEEILKLTVEKSRLLADSELAYLFFRREGQGPFNLQAADGALAESLSQTSLAVDDEFFSRSILKNKPLILDKENALPARLASGFSARFGLKNTLALPVYLRGKVVAILGIGNNRRDFSYKKDDIELMDIFAKQIAIAVENDMLMQRVEKLEIKDTLTGLYNESFIRSRLDEEIKRSIAYQRPCAFVVFDLDNFQQFRQKYGAPSAEATLKKAATIIKDSVSQIDRVARIGDDEFGVLIPEKNKRQALALAETIRKKLEFGFSEELDAQKRITASAGVSENPLDGVTQEELVSEAKKLVGLAKSKGKNRVASLKEPR